MARTVLQLTLTDKVPGRLPFGPIDSVIVETARQSTMHHMPAAYNHPFASSSMMERTNRSMPGMQLCRHWQRVEGRRKGAECIYRHACADCGNIGHGSHACYSNNGKSRASGRSNGRGGGRGEGKHSPHTKREAGSSFSTPNQA